jgi:hypothetical protein
MESCRVLFNSVPILHYTEPILNAFINETEVCRQVCLPTPTCLLPSFIYQFWGQELSKYDPSVLVVYSVDSYDPNFLTHGSLSAYPPYRNPPVFPSSIYYGWTDISADQHMDDAIRTSATTLERVGILNGQGLENAPAYVNYAISGTPLEKIYGGNVPRLQGIRKEYDPKDVMGLAGGWKF